MAAEKEAKRKGEIGEQKKKEANFRHPIQWHVIYQKGAHPLQKRKNVKKCVGEPNNWYRVYGQDKWKGRGKDKKRRGEKKPVPLGYGSNVIGVRNSWDKGSKNALTTHGRSENSIAKTANKLNERKEAAAMQKVSHCRTS